MKKLYKATCELTCVFACGDPLDLRMQAEDACREEMSMGSDFDISFTEITNERQIPAGWQDAYAYNDDEETILKEWFVPKEPDEVPEIDNSDQQLPLTL